MRVHSGLKQQRSSGLVGYLAEVFQYRSLIWKITVRDLKIQYAQSVLGLLWALIQPITGLVLYTFLFDVVIQVTGPDVPYPIFVFIGAINWFFFSAIVNRCGTSLVSNPNIIKTTYFPKLVLPISKLLVALVEFGLSFLILIVLLIIFQYSIDWRVLLIPVFLLLNIITGLSIGVWLSALTIRYRDFHHIIPYLVNFGIFITPVFFPVDLIPERLHYLMYINPMAGVIEGFRWCIMGGAFDYVRYLPVLAVVLFVFITGIFYFYKEEENIAELI